MVALLVQGLGALLLTLVCGTLYLYRRRPYFLAWAVSWTCLGVYRIGQTLHLSLFGQIDSLTWLQVLLAVAVAFHGIWWVHGVRLFVPQPPAALPAPSRKLWPLPHHLGIALGAAAVLTIVPRLVTPLDVCKVLLLTFLLLVYGASSFVFAVQSRRRRRVGALLLAIFVALLGADALHNFLVENVVIPGNDLAGYIATTAFINFFLMCLMAMGFVMVMLDDDQLTLKQALERLRESEDRFRLIFEHGGVGMALLAEGGQILEANPALQRMLGYGDDELRGRHLSEFLHPEDIGLDTLNRAREAGDPAGAAGRPGAALSDPVNPTGPFPDSSTELYEREKRYRHKNGPTIWARVLRVPVRDDGGTLRYHVGVLVDITEHRKAERALAASEERYRLLFQASLDGLLVLSDEGVVLDANPAVCAMLGGARATLLSRPLAELASDGASLRRRLRSVLARGGERFETVLKRGDGSLIDVEMSGAVVPAGAGTEENLFPGLMPASRPTRLVSCRDVSERKRAEEALRQSELERRCAEQNLREERDFITTVLDTADALIVVLDPQGRVVRFNGKSARVSGYTEEE